MPRCRIDGSPYDGTWSVAILGNLSRDDRAAGSDQSHKEATARSANRRLPVSFKALIRRLTIGGHARQQ